MMEVTVIAHNLQGYDGDWLWFKFSAPNKEKEFTFWVADGQKHERNPIPSIISLKNYIHIVALMIGKGMMDTLCK